MCLIKWNNGHVVHMIVMCNFCIIRRCFPTCRRTMQYPSFLTLNAQAVGSLLFLNSDLPFCRKRTKRCYRQPCCAYAVCMGKETSWNRKPRSSLTWNKSEICHRVHKQRTTSLCHHPGEHSQTSLSISSWSIFALIFCTLLIFHIRSTCPAYLSSVISWISYEAPALVFHT